jgi:hypothetical protein
VGKEKEYMGKEKEYMGKEKFFKKYDFFIFLF